MPALSQVCFHVRHADELAQSRCCTPLHRQSRHPSCILQAGAQREVNIRCSFLEIYNEVSSGVAVYMSVYCLTRGQVACALSTCGNLRSYHMTHPAPAGPDRPAEPGGHAPADPRGRQEGHLRREPVVTRRPQQCHSAPRLSFMICTCMALWSCRAAEHVQPRKRDNSATSQRRVIPCMFLPTLQWVRWRRCWSRGS